MKRRRAIAWLLAVLVTSGVACKDGSKSGSKSKGPMGAKKPTPTAARKLVPQILWRTPYKGRLHAFAVVKGVVVVASRGRGDRVSARRIAGFSASSGKKLSEMPLKHAPAFDGMSAARGCLYLATQDGHVVCMKSRP